MPHEIPSWAELVERYPEFDGIYEGFITPILEEASGHVSARWREEHYGPAILAMAAHLLSQSGHGTKPGNPVGAAMKSRTVGDVTTTFADGAAGQGGELGSTPYGRYYLRLLRLNAPIGIIAAPGVHP